MLFKTALNRSYLMNYLFKITFYTILMSKNKSTNVFIVKLYFTQVFI